MKEFYRDKMERLEEESKDQLVQEAYEVGVKHGAKTERARCIAILEAEYVQYGKDMRAATRLEVHRSKFEKAEAVNVCLRCIKKGEPNE